MSIDIHSAIPEGDGAPARQLDWVEQRQAMPKKRQKLEMNRSGPVLMEDLKRESGAARGLLQRIEAKYPGDPLRQANALAETMVFNAATGRVRPPSIKTREAYKFRWRTCLRDLKVVNMGVQNLSQLSKAHAPALVRYWETQGMATSSMQNTLTALRRLLVWCGKPNAVPALKEMVSEEGKAKRLYAATSPKGLAGKGILAEDLCTEMDRECRVAGLQLRIVLAFGLRVEEVVMMRPAIADQGRVLIVSYGTKGGRARVVPIETTHQRDLLERAKAIASGNAKGILTDRASQKFHKARTRFYYLAKKIGLTQKRLGVTPHGLRHEYANQTYQMLTGVPAPVLGGPRLPKDQDEAARLEVAERLGHGRVSVSAAYLGSHVVMERMYRHNLLALAQAFKDEAVRAAIAGAGITRLQVVGDLAEGKDVGRVAVCAWEGASPHVHPEINDELTKALSRALGGRFVAFTPMEHLGSNVPTFEVF